jgi:hypothetical protein
MATNDFRSVGSLLADDFELEYPQSGERIRGRENYAALNEEYPAHGPWTFTVNQLVADDHCLRSERAADKIDSSLKKTFRLSERFKLNFRAAAFNLFNHPTYKNPGRRFTAIFALWFMATADSPIQLTRKQLILRFRDRIVADIRSRQETLLPFPK